MRRIGSKRRTCWAGRRGPLGAPGTAALHEWLTLDPAERPCLIAVSDDATKRVFHAAWWSMTARLAAVLRTGSRPRPAPGGSVAEACDTRRSADGLDNAPWTGGAPDLLIHWSFSSGIEHRDSQRRLPIPLRFYRAKHSTTFHGNINHQQGPGFRRSSLL